MDGEITGINELTASLARLRGAGQQAERRALVRCGLLAVREAKANAPRSPTMAVHSKTLKRKRRTTRKLLPGGLEKSIAYEVEGGACSVFVAANSFAGKYAKRIHDEKGQTWRNRGAGTVAKGSRADDKFIYRALRDNVDKFRAIVEDELQKAIRNKETGNG